MPFRKPFVALVSFGMFLSGCAKDGELDSTGGVTVTRSSCPAVAVPVYTGDITVFDPPASRESRAIDIEAAITNVRSACNDSGDNVISTVNFEVQARRTNANGPREVILPYFASVVHGGKAVVSKSVSRVTIRFADGELRASAKGSASAAVNRSAATLPKEIEDRITRKRKAGDADAAIDPMADPTVREAVLRASFELLIGFQLSQAQLQYNATR